MRYDSTLDPELCRTNERLCIAYRLAVKVCFQLPLKGDPKLFSSEPYTEWHNENRSFFYQLHLLSATQETYSNTPHPAFTLLP